MKEEKKKKNYTLYKTHGRELPVAAHGPGSFPLSLESREVVGAVYSWNAQTRRVTFRVFTRARRRASPSVALSLRGTSTPADENRNGNVGSSRIASRRAASLRGVASRRPVARECLSLFFLFSSPIPEHRYSVNTIPFPSASLRYIPVMLSRRWKRTDRRPTWELRRKDFRGGEPRALRAQSSRSRSNTSRRIFARQEQEAEIEAKGKKLCLALSSHSPFLSLRCLDLVWCPDAITNERG